MPDNQTIASKIAISQETITRESHLRSILKAFTWRFVATSATFAISYIVTGKTSMAFTIAGIEVIAKLVIYYFHERVWQLVPRGTIRKLLKRR